MTAYEVPLVAGTPQKVKVPLAGVTYTLTVKWCVPANCWVVDIADATGTPILSGIPLITGADLLAQYGYLNFGGQIQCQTDHDLLAPPTFDNLGITGHAFFVVL